ncbi:MAG: hypothetical protein RLW62_19730 [Gammaproteobacteria bacterium]
MNEYAVTLADAAGQRELTLLAATAAAARDAAEAAHAAEVIAVRFVRAVTFSCRTRDGRAAR